MTYKLNYAICYFCCCIFCVLLIVAGVSQIPDYLAIHDNVPIKITFYNSTSEPPIYTFSFQKPFLCITSISAISINECNNITNCPLDIGLNKIYDYYCDCDKYKCSFMKTNNFYTSYQFLMIIIGSGIITIGGIILWVWDAKKLEQ